MWQKILGIGAVVLLAGGLLGGGAYILLRDNTNGSAHSSSGRAGNTANASGGGRGAGGTQGFLETGTGQGGFRGGHGDETRGTTGALQNEDPQAAENIEEWVTVTGTVLEMEEDLVLRATDGTEMVFALGPSWYRETQEEVFLPGDLVTVSGFYEEGSLTAAQITDATSGQTLALRDETGRPLWAGRGQGRRGQ